MIACGAGKPSRRECAEKDKPAARPFQGHSAICRTRRQTSVRNKAHLSGLIRLKTLSYRPQLWQIAKDSPPERWDFHSPFRNIYTYNQPQWLEKVIWGYIAQTHQDFELIIADDGSREDTRQMIERLQGAQLI